MDTRTKRPDEAKGLDGAETIRSIAADNPAVNLGDVAEALKMLRELRGMGLTGPSYNLKSPYAPSTVHSAHEGTWATGESPDSN